MASQYLEFGDISDVWQHVKIEDFKKAVSLQNQLKDVVFKFNNVQSMSVMPLKQENGNYNPSKLFVEIAVTEDTTESTLEDIMRCCEEVNANSANCITFVKQTWKFCLLCGDDENVFSSLGCFVIQKQYNNDIEHHTTAPSSDATQILPGHTLIALDLVTEKSTREPTYEERFAERERQELDLRAALFGTTDAHNNHPVQIHQPARIDSTDGITQVQDQSKANRYFISCGHCKKNKKIYIGEDFDHEIKCDIQYNETEQSIVEDFCIGKISDQLNCANRIISNNNEEMIANLHFLSEEFEKHVLKCTAISKRGHKTKYTESKWYSTSILCRYISGSIVSVKMCLDKDSSPFASKGDSGSVVVDKASGGVIGMIVGFFIKEEHGTKIELIAVRPLPKNFLSTYDVL